MCFALEALALLLLALVFFVGVLDVFLALDIFPDNPLGVFLIVPFSISAIVLSSRPAALAILLVVAPALRALDIAVFLHLLNNMDDFLTYSTEALGNITTLSCEFEKIANGEAVEDWVTEIDTRLNLEFKG